MSNLTFETEWGVEDKFGPHPSANYEAAKQTAENMNKADWPAKIVWRGVTAWMEEDKDD